MPVPSSISDLSTTASSNSPAGSETPTEGDNYLRTLSSFIALLRDKLNGTSATGTVKDATISGTATLTADNLKSGTYTPTLTNVANVSSSTPLVFQWVRVGNVVTVSGEVGISFASNDADVQTQVGISLPVASTLAGRNEVAGSCSSASDGATAGSVSGDVTNARASMNLRSPYHVSSLALSVHFTYRVI